MFLGHLSPCDYLDDQQEGESYYPDPFRLDQPHLNSQHLYALSTSSPHSLQPSMGHPNPYGNQGFHGGGSGRAQPHPFLSINPITRMIILRDPAHPGRETLLHPLHVQLYLNFDLEVCRTHGDPSSPIPMGYYLFASILNSADPNTEC